MNTLLFLLFYIPVAAWIFPLVVAIGAYFWAKDKNQGGKFNYYIFFGAIAGAILFTLLFGLI